jgi:CRISPR-associated exonuclease Cas4
MYSDDDLVPISALQHILYCERQCALIHVEQIWRENRLTVEGKQQHQRVDEGGHESRKDRRNEYRVQLCSFRHGLSGYADLIEYHRDDKEIWHPYPVEFKHGTEKGSDVDRVQLCAQALCLEEMLDVVIPRGALFYEKVRRRSVVEFTEALRSLTAETAIRVHELIAGGRIPVALLSAACRNCSLIEACMPAKCRGGPEASRYIANRVSEIEAE